MIEKLPNGMRVITREEANTILAEQLAKPVGKREVLLFAYQGLWYSLADIPADHRPAAMVEFLKLIYKYAS